MLKQSWSSTTSMSLGVTSAERYARSAAVRPAPAPTDPATVDAQRALGGGERPRRFPAWARVAEHSLVQIRPARRAQIAFDP